MQHDVVADRDVVAENQWIRVMCHVEQGEVLDVGAPPDPDIIDVAADDAVKPHTGVGFDDHVADNYRGVFDKGRVRNGRGNAFVGLDHGRLCLSLQSFDDNFQPAFFPSSVRRGEGR